jgi:hypothetical protein
MKRLTFLSAGAVVGIVLFGVANLGPLASTFHPAGRPIGDPIDVADRGGVVSTSAEPYPEGSSIEPFTLTSGPAGLTIHDVERFIPATLPAPLSQGTCDVGETILFEFVDGSGVRYGPCDRPEAVEKTWSDMKAILQAEMGTRN